MARIRSVKPELWTDSAFVACSPLARLLFIGVWNHADDYGVVKDDPAQLRRQILPEDLVDGAELVDELVDVRLLNRMEAPGGVAVLVVRTWERHQKVDNRSPGRYGMPADFLPGPTDSPPIPPDPPRSQPLPTLEGKGMEGTSSSSDPPDRREDVDRLCDLLASLIEGNGCRRPTINDAWRRSARLLLDRDEVPESEAEEIMRWTLADDFWRSNVLSMPTFRKHFDRLKLKRASETGQRNGNGLAPVRLDHFGHEVSS